MGRFPNLGLVLALALLLGGAGPAWAVEKFEEPPLLKASQILPKELVVGPHHEVSQKVVNDGILNHYTVNSKYGQFKARGITALRKLVQEIKAIDLMVRVEQDEAFAKSFEDSGKKTAGGIKSLAEDPEKTLKGAARGVGSLFDRAGESLFGSKRSQAEGSRGEDLIGFTKTKREVAAKFGVDVYSTNKVLQEHLDRIAWADFYGGLGLSAALAVIPGAAGIAMSATGATRLLNDVVATTPPSDLRRMNRKKLAAMGVDADAIDLFINNTVFSPRDQTFLVGSLEAMKGSANRDLFILVALGATSRTQAFFLSYMAQLYAAYHLRVSKIKRFHPVARILYASTVNGGLVFNVPADYIIWSAKSAGALRALDARPVGGSAPKSKQIWTVGQLSPLAAKNSKARGWTIKQHSEKILFPKK
jgi:hypothetical protein